MDMDCCGHTVRSYELMAYYTQGMPKDNKVTINCMGVHKLNFSAKV
jgi:hypothetical protein